MKRHDWIRLVGWQQRQRQQRKKAKKIKVSDVIVFYGTKSGETNGSGRNNEPNSYYTWNVFEENYTKLNNNEKKSDLTRLEFGRFCENNTHTHTLTTRQESQFRIIIVPFHERTHCPFVSPWPDRWDM